MGELRFHAATLDDAAFAADVWTAARPSAPVDPVVKRYWWATPSETYVSERYVVTRGGERIGFALVDHVRWDGPGPRYVSLRGDLLPEVRTAARHGCGNDEAPCVFSHASWAGKNRPASKCSTPSRWFSSMESES